MEKLNVYGDPSGPRYPSCTRRKNLSDLRWLRIRNAEKVLKVRDWDGNIHVNIRR